MTSGYRTGRRARDTAGPIGTPVAAPFRMKPGPRRCFDFLGFSPALERRVQVSWDCPCGVSNRESKAECRACRTPKDVMGSTQGFPFSMEARLLAKVTQHGAPSADHLGRLVRLVWIAGIIVGGWSGFYLARIRVSQGRWAMEAAFTSWKRIPWTFWDALTTGLGMKTVIGIGIILPLLFFLLPGQVRQQTLPFFGHMLLAVILAVLVGTFAYSLVVFAYDLGPYFRFRW